MYTEKRMTFTHMCMIQGLIMHEYSVVRSLRILIIASQCKLVRVFVAPIQFINIQSSFNIDRNHVSWFLSCFKFIMCNFKYEQII